MASRGAMAARSSVARDRLQAAIARLCEREGVEMPPRNAFPYRQVELRVAADMETLALAVERVLGDEPEKPDEGTGDEEPEFHGHPLSYFDGKSDEDILAEKGIGQATLDKIREAQAERDE